MKTFISSIAFIAFILFNVCISSPARGQIADDFSDGDFIHDPVWIGDTAQFEVNAAGQLHLRSEGNDTAVLFSGSSPGIGWEWEFWMKLSFNTSVNNHARVYLAADTSLPLAMVNSLYVQAGGAADSISVIRQTGDISTILYSVKSFKTMHSTNTLRIKITCDESGSWKVMLDTTGGHNYIEDGFFSNEFLPEGNWFGLMCRYTSSNATKFYFDDLYAGPIRHDTTAPRVYSTEALSAKVFQIAFSEPVEKSGAENQENYAFLSHEFKIDSVVQDVLRREVVLMFLKDSLMQGMTDTIMFRDIMDLSGNRLQDTAVQVCYYRPQAYDVLIHEIMADPEPPVGLPRGEFVELYNRTGFPINLKDWSFRYGSYVKTFPPMIIPAKGYLLIVMDSAYLGLGQCALIFTSSSSLSNEGTTLVLKDSQQHEIHSVTYSPDWYRGTFKEDGGWSLEMADPSNPCGCMGNWEPSKDPAGGTPGRDNSVSKANPDEIAPVLVRAFILDSLTLEVQFSESMDSLSILLPEYWNIQGPDGVAQPAGVLPVSPGFQAAKLVSQKPFMRDITYFLSCSGNMNDCARVPFDTTRTIRFAIPETAASHDVVINEILSNPSVGGSRFVELYNRSEKVIDLQTIVLATHDTAAGSLPNATPMTTGGFLLFPGDYLALTSSAEDISGKYRPADTEAIFTMEGFPVFGDDTGTLTIARKDNLSVIDRMRYSPGMHYPLLVTTEGVSLERTSPDLPSEDPENWHSAAETAGFATPGYRNSHWISGTESDQDVLIQPAIFSPDNDGRDDLLLITLKTGYPDESVSMVVYDSRGRRVAVLANNVLTGTETAFIWDGMTAARRKAPMGLYVLLIERTRPDGNTRRIKKTVVLGGRL
jgi:hypothetical protein